MKGAPYYTEKSKRKDAVKRGDLMESFFREKLLTLRKRHSFVGPK